MIWPDLMGAKVPPNPEPAPISVFIIDGDVVEIITQPVIVHLFAVHRGEYLLRLNDTFFRLISDGRLEVEVYEPE